MKTSYFGKLRSLDLSSYYIVQVCTFAPKGVPVNAVLTPALPGWRHLVVPYKEGLINEAEYEVTYMRFLDANRDSILAAVKDVLEKAAEKEPLLLYYEKPSDWCHRHVLARWLRREGVPVEEL